MSSEQTPLERLRREANLSVAELAVVCRRIEPQIPDWPGYIREIESKGTERYFGITLRVVADALSAARGRHVSVDELLGRGERRDCIPEQIDGNHEYQTGAVDNAPLFRKIDEIAEEAFHTPPVSPDLIHPRNPSAINPSRRYYLSRFVPDLSGAVKRAEDEFYGNPESGEDRYSLIAKDVSAQAQRWGDERLGYLYGLIEQLAADCDVDPDLWTIGQYIKHLRSQLAAAEKQLATRPVVVRELSEDEWERCFESCGGNWETLPTFSRERFQGRVNACIRAATQPANPARAALQKKCDELEAELAKVREELEAANGE